MFYYTVAIAVVQSQSCLEPPFLRGLQSQANSLVGRSQEPELPFKGGSLKKKKKSVVLVVSIKSVHL